MSKLPTICHSRVGGNPLITRTPLDSGLRGNDLCVARYRRCRVTIGKSHLPSVPYRRSNLPGANTESFIYGYVLFELSFQIELILNSITVRNS